MQVKAHRPIYFSRMKNGLFFLRLLETIIIAFFLVTGTERAFAETLSNHLKRLTSALSNRNLDSLRLLIDPHRIYVEIAPKEGSYLSPSQTLGVVESFFQSHPPVSFSYTLVKEEGKTGITFGRLVAAENGRIIVHKVNFGFEKNRSTNWILIRIIIR